MVLIYDFHGTFDRCVKVRLYAPQTQILEGWTKDEMRIFEGSTFQWLAAQIEYSTPLKRASFEIRIASFVPHSKFFV